MAENNEQLRPGLPLIRLSLLTPFITELDRRKINIDHVLDQFDLNRDNLHSPDVFVTSPVMYKLLDAMAATANDRYLALYIGETLDIYSWPVFSSAAREATSFVEFIFRFSKSAGEQATSVSYRLDTDGEYALFRAYRLSEPDSCPGQADAFYVGLFKTIFQRCTGEAWDPAQVQVKVCDTDAIPKNYQNILVSEGDRRGCTIRFPQEWLLLPFDLREFKQRRTPEVIYQAPSKSLIEAIRQALLPHIHQPDLNNELAAELCGFEPRTLARKLKVKGTTISKQINNIREEVAIKMLVETKRPVSDIASAVGYYDPSVFTRSFKRWTGVSPSAYRKQHSQRS